MRFFNLTVILLTVLMISSCSKDDEVPPDLGDLTGVWELNKTVRSNTCGLTDGNSESELIILIQCGNQISIIAGNGLLGSGTITGNSFEFNGFEVQTDMTGCKATYSHSGTLSGTSTRLEGNFSTSIAYDATSCGSISACNVETNANISLTAAYTDCIDRAEFGNPASSDYVLPWSAGKSYRLNNSYCIPTGGHREQQAYDFLIPVGDTIVAARAGTVRQVKQDSPDNGQGSDHNHVMIEHDDGTLAFYAHLMQQGVLIEVGEEVVAGEAIALAGHSGTTDVAHLHFGVYDYYPPKEGDDRAVNFSNMEGPVDCRSGLVNGAIYTSK